MKVEFSFQHVDVSDALISHCQERARKLVRFELKPMDVRFTFSMQRHERIVEVRVNEGRRLFRARSVANDFYRAVEMTLNKLLRQLSKDKSRIKNHKNPDGSALGRLDLLNETQESDVDSLPVLKTG